jgi:hypothetical protein
MPESSEEHEATSSPANALANWTSYDAPFAVKLRMAVSNTLIKVRGRQGCCGNPGQPGC